MTELVNIDFQPMLEGEPEYILSDEFNLTFPHRKFQTISHEEAKLLYFSEKNDEVFVYVVAGGQKGDEAKAKATDLFIDMNEQFSCSKTQIIDYLTKKLTGTESDSTQLFSIFDFEKRNSGRIKWVLAANSTHNAGKGVWTKNELGEGVRVSLHLCPKSIVDSEIKNYVGPNTQVNLFGVKKEVETTIRATQRNKLGINYHLMIDRHANLVTPFNRANDIVGASSAMNSTISGATDSFKQAGGKNTPVLEDALYDHNSYLKFVKKQLVEFVDKLGHDQEFNELGITDMKSFGQALYDEELMGQNRRLKALGDKLSAEEKDFFLQDGIIRQVINYMK